MSSPDRGRSPGEGRPDGGGRSADGGRPGDGRPRGAGIELAGLSFTRRELLDFVAAWVALSVAFTGFLFGPEVFLQEYVVTAFGVSLVTSGVGFVLHELAHKVVAVRFDQVAQFRADYGMLFIAVISGLAGFLFAAPGAVHHVGRITERENGLIALAGPLTNLVLVVAFVPLIYLAPGRSVLSLVGQIGVTVNAFLAAFNMIPYGPLDGRTVYRWSKPVFAVAFLTAAGLTAALLAIPGIGGLRVGL